MYLWYFFCNCKRLCRDKRHSEHGGVGKRHGPVWAEIMLQIIGYLERTCKVKWSVDGWIAESLYEEMGKSNWEPGKAFKLRWGCLDYEQDEELQEIIAEESEVLDKPKVVGSGFWWWLKGCP